jgi:hypothetical protein
MLPHVKTVEKYKPFPVKSSQGILFPVRGN